MIVSCAASTLPTASLVTIPEVKAAARIDSGHEDDLLAGYITAAEVTIEHLCRRSFRAQTWTAYYSDVTIGTAEILPRSPVASVVVSYKSDANTWTVATVNTLLGAAPACWYPPATVTPYVMMDGSPNWKAVAVCGADTLPQPVKNAIILLAGHLFDQRSPIVIGAPVAEIPFTIDALISPYKTTWI
jgi:uncharacterized phiE125 gp8 family phage protein